jgi:putative transposase
MTYPLVRELRRDGIPVAVTCRVLKFSPQGYYQWLKNPCSARDYENAYLVNDLLDVHDADSTYGYRFLSDEVSMLGWNVGERRVWRLCSDMKIWASYLKKAGPGKSPGPAVHDDLVLRKFNADAPNTLWFTDFTEHWTGEGKLYLASIEDACSGGIVGYSISDRMTRHVACAALRNAIALRSPKGTIVHSDYAEVFVKPRIRDFVSAGTAA